MKHGDIAVRERGWVVSHDKPFHPSVAALFRMNPRADKQHGKQREKWPPGSSPACSLIACGLSASFQLPLVPLARHS